MGKQDKINIIKAINFRQKSYYKIAKAFIKNEDFIGVENFLMQHRNNTITYFLFLYKLYSFCDSLKHWEKLNSIQQKIPPVNNSFLLDYLAIKESDTWKRLKYPSCENILTITS
jgi:hypothetical protein